jgi:hypothetical protein
MRLEVTRVEGRRNDLLLRLERSEIDSALLSVASRDRLMALPGIPRHRDATAGETRGLEEAKVPIDAHVRTLGLLDEAGRPRRRLVAVSNRNLGTNHGHLAWQRDESPRVFHVREDPSDYPAYSCLTVWRSGGVSIEDLRFDIAGQRVSRAADGRDLSDEIQWATFGQQVLRGGRVAGIGEIAHQFYDLRHLLTPAAGGTLRDLYRGYPGAFRENVRKAWMDEGLPRARYVHSALGLSKDAVLILQREGTIEEIGSALEAAGAEDGLILDNGGSVACWIWWANDYAGGLVSPTVDYRPPGTSAIMFVLEGPVRTALPPGSVSPTVT